GNVTDTATLAAPALDPLDAIASARIALIDVDGDGRRDIVAPVVYYDNFEEAPFFGLLTVTHTSATTLAYQRRAILPLSSTTDVVIGAPVVHDFDGDGRLDAVYSVLSTGDRKRALLGVLPRATGTPEVRILRQYSVEDSILEDVTGDGLPD